MAEEDRSGTVTLATVVAELRKELLEAQKAGEGEELRLELLEATVELQVSIHNEWGEKEGVSLFWVGELTDKQQKGQTQKITLKLKPGPGEGPLSGWVS